MKMQINCGLCNQSLPSKPALSLTPTPPANEFVRAEDVGKTQDEFPLDLYMCSNCGHIQLTSIVDPSRLFKNYVYVAGTSPVFVAHFQRYAHEAINRFQLIPGDFVVDIGSNDGTLLKFFKAQGMQVLGIDPAVDIATKAINEGISTIIGFFTEDLSQKINSEFGQASLIVANNVFAHAEDLHGIVTGVHNLLKQDGCFIFEVSYFVDVCENTLFDTIYSEHIHYHTLGPLIQFFKNHGMCVVDAERINTHGGSLRVYVKNCLDSVVNQGVFNCLNIEKRLGFDSTKPLENLNTKIQNLKNQLVTRLHEIKSEGKSIAAYGAPAKATTLMYHFGLDKSMIDFVVDDSPLKQNLFTPGKHVPVLPSSAIKERKPDYLLILAWNFADSIIAKNKNFSDRGGKFIVPIPELKEC